MRNQFIVTPYFLDEAWPSLEGLAQPGWVKNKPGLSGDVQLERMSIIHDSLAGHVSEAVRNGMRPVSVAGDCCSAIGVLAGLQGADVHPILVWFDAHGDFNTWETTPSNFLGGMPLAMLVGRGEQKLVDAVRLENLEEDQVILTDARDLDPGEQEALVNSAVIHLKDVQDLLEFPLPERPLYVHVDMDVLSPEAAPAMSYLAQGGPSADELKDVFQNLAMTNRVIAVSVSSWNPGLDENGESQKTCLDVLQSLVEDR
jgi:arginase